MDADADDDSITVGFFDKSCCGGGGGEGEDAKDEGDSGVDFDGAKSFGDDEATIVGGEELQSVVCGGLVVEGAVAVDIATANP
jgi:hypothetical protein